MTPPHDLEGTAPNPRWPFARMTIRDHRVYLHRWMPSLAVSAKELPLYWEMAARGVTLADLIEDESEGRRELFVRVVPGHALTEQTRGLLLAWSYKAGYGRVWLGPDGGVAHPQREELPLAGESSTCPVCDWELDQTEHQIGPGPIRPQRTPRTFCQVCGSSSMPQATLELRDGVA